MLNKPRGQTLMESLLAITVILIGLVSLVSLFIALNVAGRQSQDKLVAMYLAQEGLEIVRNFRDSDWLAQEVNQSVVWTANWVDSSDATAVPVLSGSQNWFLSFKPNDYTPIYQDDQSKLYEQFEGVVPAGHTQTKWSRILNITALSSGTAYQVTSSVQWTEQGKIHNYVLAENLYDWRNY